MKKEPYWIEYDQIPKEEQNNQFNSREELMEYVISNLNGDYSSSETMNDFVNVCLDNGYIVWRGTFPEQKNPVLFQ